VEDRHAHDPPDKLEVLIMRNIRQVSRVLAHHQNACASRGQA
jgi:hypothetical protein